MRGDVYRLRASRDVKGHEQQGRRYAVVVQSDELDVLPTWMVAPTSTSARPATFRPRIEIDGTPTRVLVEQTTAVDPSRLGDQVGHLGFDQLRAVDAALRLVLSLGGPARTTSAVVPDRPEIVCICGSTRFAAEIRAVNRELTFAGAVVVAPGEADGTITQEQKVALDALHLRKVDLADRVVVVNPGGYVGESTSREIAYARAAGKPVSFTDPV